MSAIVSKRTKILLLVLIGVIGLALGAVVTATQARPKPIFFLPPRGENILYLAPNATLAVNLPVSTTDLIVNGVTVVDDSADFHNRVTTGTSVIDAVIIHKSRFADVNQAEIRHLYEKGTVIAGVNVSVRELGRMIGDDYVANDSTWTDGWQKEPFYSILAFKATGTTEEQQRALVEGRLLGHAMRSTDNISNPSDVDVFLSLIRRNIWELRELESSSSSK